MWRMKIFNSLHRHVGFWPSMLVWITKASTTTPHSVCQAFPVKPPGFSKKTQTECIVWMTTISLYLNLCKKTIKMILTAFNQDYDDDAILVLEYVDRAQVLMDTLVFRQACKRLKFKPRADLLASATHKQLHRYYSRTTDSKALGTNACLSTCRLNQPLMRTLRGR